jgi:hypothetical protein
MQAAKTLGMTARETPGAMAFMLTPESVAAGRIIAGRSPITHSSDFGPGKHRQLPHKTIVPQKIAAR